MSDKTIEISAMTGLMFGNGLSMCAQSLSEVLSELKRGEITPLGLGRIANAVEFIGGVGGDFTKHAKKVQARERV